MEIDDKIAGREATLRETIEILKPFRKDGGPVTAETDLIKDLNLDSLAVMDLMMALEERFDVSIPLNVVPELHTVADLADQIYQIKGES